MQSIFIGMLVVTDREPNCTVSDLQIGFVTKIDREIRSGDKYFKF
jgi:hypothetical protein